MGGLASALCLGLACRAANPWSTMTSGRFLLWNLFSSYRLLLVLAVAMVPFVEMPKFRKTERFRSNERVRVTRDDGQTICELRDLSIRGALIGGLGGMRVAEPLLVELDDGTRLDAVVRRVTADGLAGVEFQLESRNETRLISRVLLHRSLRSTPLPVEREQVLRCDLARGCDMTARLDSCRLALQVAIDVSNQLRDALRGPALNALAARAGDETQCYGIANRLESTQLPRELGPRPDLRAVRFEEGGARAPVVWARHDAASEGIEQACDIEQRVAPAAVLEVDEGDARRVHQNVVAVQVPVQQAGRLVPELCQLALQTLTQAIEQGSMWRRNGGFAVGAPKRGGPIVRRPGKPGRDGEAPLLVVQAGRGRTQLGHGLLGDTGGRKVPFQPAEDHARARLNMGRAEDQHQLTIGGCHRLWNRLPIDAQPAEPRQLGLLLGDRVTIVRADADHVARADRIGQTIHGVPLVLQELTPHGANHESRGDDLRQLVEVTNLFGVRGAAKVGHASTRPRPWRLPSEGSFCVDFVPSDQLCLAARNTPCTLGDFRGPRLFGAWVARLIKARKQFRSKLSTLGFR